MARGAIVLEMGMIPGQRSADPADFDEAGRVFERRGRRRPRVDSPLCIVARGGAHQVIQKRDDQEDEEDRRHERPGKRAPGEVSSLDADPCVSPQRTDGAGGDFLDFEGQILGALRVQDAELSLPDPQDVPFGESLTSGHSAVHPKVSGVGRLYGDSVGALDENAVVQRDRQTGNVQGVVGTSPDRQPFDLDDLFLRPGPPNGAT